MTIAGIIVIFTGLSISIFEVVGVTPIFLNKFAALFGVDAVGFGLIIALLGGLVLLIDIILSHYRLHPLRLRSNVINRDNSKTSLKTDTPKVPDSNLHSSEE